MLKLLVFDYCDSSECEISAAGIERRRRELDRAISPGCLARGSASPFRACMHSTFKGLVELPPLAITTVPVRVGLRRLPLHVRWYFFIFAIND